VVAITLAALSAPRYAFCVALGLGQSGIAMLLGFLNNKFQERRVTK